MSLTNITPVGDKQLKYRVKQCSGGTREVFFNQNSEQCSMHTGIFIANIGIFPKHRWLWLLHVQNISSSTIRKPFYKSGCILSISRLSFEFVQIWLNLCSLILLIYLLRTHNKYFCLLLTILTIMTIYWEMPSFFSRPDNIWDSSIPMSYPCTDELTKAIYWLTGHPDHPDHPDHFDHPDHPNHPDPDQNIVQNCV